MTEKPEKDDLYPLLFEPFYKCVMWGGRRLATKLNRPLPPELKHIGEAWDICDRPGMESTVVNGPLEGTSIHELLTAFGTDFAGTKFRGERFPLIVKLIDAEKNLSLQVHPDEHYCSRKRGDFCEPKTEMWYILEAESHAKVFVGLKGNTTRQQFMDHLNSAQIENDVQSFDSIPGDAYFINAGRIHMIGAGNLLLEISQNSDTGYRIHDWDRPDEEGKLRPLHLHEALSCMDFIDRTASRISGASNTTDHNRKYPIINRCPYFVCHDLKLVDEWRDNTENSGSFHILTTVNEPIAVENMKFRTEVPAGTSVLIPACFGRYVVKVTPGVTTTVIRTTL